MTGVAHEADLPGCDDFGSARLIPLWTQIDGLIAEHPEPAAQRLGQLSNSHTGQLGYRGPTAMRPDGVGDELLCS